MSDPQEEAFSFEIWSASTHPLVGDRWVKGIDITQLDTFLSSGALDEVSRTELLGERESAFVSYQQGDFDTALLKMIALNRMCQQFGYIQLARHGIKFTGRKPGAVGSVRKAVTRLLKKNPKCNNLDLWEAIKKRPPKGWTVMENSRLGRYIENPNMGGHVKWARFCNIASEVRKELK